MEKQTTIFSYPDMAVCGTTSQPNSFDKTIQFHYGGWYMSDIFDSGHMGMTWGRLFLQGDFHSINVDIWIEDNREKLVNLQDEIMSFQPKIHSVFPHVLLKQAQGRYLRFRLHIPLKETACLRGFEINYPYRSHIEFLPQMYQDNEDLHLFMAPFEDTFLALQKEIRQLPRMWNPVVATQEQLLNMVSFLHLEVLLQEDIDTLRTILIHHPIWRYRRGTYETLFFFATTVLKRNVLLISKDGQIQMIAVYHEQEEAKRVENLLSSQIAFGVDFYITWIVDGVMEDSYLDIGVSLDRKAETCFDSASIGDLLWL